MPTIAFCLTSVHPHATPYYNLFPIEPIPGGSNAFVNVDRVVALADNRVVTLLTAIRENVKEKNSSIIVISHGNEEGLSLTLARERGGRGRLDARAINVLRANLAGNHDDFETAKRLELGTYNAAKNPEGVADVVALKTALAPVRALGLTRVDLRACIVGQRLDTLRQLQFFFNADVCCGPNEWDTFGPIPFADITTNPSSWRKFREEHPAAMMVGSGDERFALDYKILGNENKVMLAAIATSQAAIDMWVQNHLPPSTRYKGGTLVYHGVTDKKKLVIFAGEGAFRDHLIAVSDGRDGTIKVNDGISREGF